MTLEEALAVYLFTQAQGPTATPASIAAAEDAMRTIQAHARIAIDRHMMTPRAQRT